MAVVLFPRKIGRTILDHPNRLPSMARATNKNLLAEVRKKIAAKKLGWEAGPSHISMLPDEEQAKFVGFKVDDETLASMGRACTALNSHYRLSAGALMLPSSVDWSNQNGNDYVQAVKNQETCLS